MTEIKRIIVDIMTEQATGGACLLPDLSRSSQEDILRKSQPIAKAIEQYVIKAKMDLILKMVENLAELEKGLKNG